MSEVKKVYREALKARRDSVASRLGADATFIEAKPDYYADARILSEDALQVFCALQESHPPYGLIDMRGKTVRQFSTQQSPWIHLTYALRATGRYVIEQAEPSMKLCPYSGALQQAVGSTRPELTPYDNDVDGLDTLRNKISPGAELNAPLFTSLLRRLPALQSLHSSTADPELFARHSVSLLREPLAHPQQWAAAFVYSLGRLQDLMSDKFLSDELAKQYTKIELTRTGVERLAWAMPTEEFATQQEIQVVDRTRGSETDREGDHIVTYPTGTKLKYIDVTEPVIGCPGDQLARAMWQRTINVIVSEGLWDLDSR